MPQKRQRKFVLPKQNYESPLDQLMSKVELEESLLEENFANEKALKTYDKEDYKIKAFLMLVTATDKTKIWMPAKTVFDKKGGKFSTKIGGLGQIPGL